MKRFLVFAGFSYYPAEGWQDFRSDHDSIEDAVAAADAVPYFECDWRQVVDTTSRSIVRSRKNNQSPWGKSANDDVAKETE